jgi:hypothetical protein
MGNHQVLHDHGYTKQVTHKAIRLHPGIHSSRNRKSFLHEATTMVHHPRENNE